MTSKGWKMQILLLPSDIKSCICDRMVPVQNLYIMILTFSRHEFWKVHIFKTVRASKKCSSTTIIEVNIFHRMGSLWIFSPWPWLKFSRSNFSSGYFDKSVKCKHYYCHQIGSQVCDIEWRHCECCTSWPWPTFSRSRIFKCEYLENGES